MIYTDPDYELTVAPRKDFQVACGPSDLKSDITMTLGAGRWLHFRDFTNSARTLPAFS